MDLNSTKLPYNIFKLVRVYLGEKNPELKRCLISHVYDKADALFRNIYGIPTIGAEGELKSGNETFSVQIETVCVLRKLVEVSIKVFRQPKALYQAVFLVLFPHRLLAIYRTVKNSTRASKTSRARSITYRTRHHVN